MDIIRTRQKNWIGHILRGNFLQILIPLNRMMPLCLILHLVHLVYYQPPPWKYSTYIFISKIHEKIMVTRLSTYLDRFALIISLLCSLILTNYCFPDIVPVHYSLMSQSCGNKIFFI